MRLGATGTGELAPGRVKGPFLRVDGLWIRLGFVFVQTVCVYRGGAARTYLGEFAGLDAQSVERPGGA